MAACAERVPALEATGPGHAAACLRIGHEQALQSQTQ
jgi:hypothetical protein